MLSLSTSTLKSFSLGLLSIHSLSSLHLCLGLPWPICSTLHLALLKFMGFTQAHLSSLSGSFWIAACSLQHVNCTIHLGVVGKLAEGALNPTVCVTDKDVKQRQSQYWSLRNAICHWSPLGRQAFDRNSLNATIEPVPYPLSRPSISFVSLQFRGKDVMWDSVIRFAQVQVDDISCSPLIHKVLPKMESFKYIVYEVCILG